MIMWKVDECQTTPVISLCSQLKKYDSLESFLSHVSRFQPPWNELKNSGWVRDELYIFLLDFVPLIRRFLKKLRGPATEESTLQNSNPVPCHTKCAESLIHFLCSLFQGLAASWGTLDEEKEMEKHSDANPQSGQLSSSSPAEEFPIISASLDASVSPSKSNLEKTIFSKNHHALECLALIIEALDCGVLCDSCLGNIVLDYTNDGILFFEALSLCNSRTQRCLLNVLEQLLNLNSVQELFFHETYLNHEKEIQANPYSMKLNERLANALVSSPHAIENFMLLLEQDKQCNDFDSEQQPHLVLCQCLVVLKLFLQIKENQHLKLILTFQNLPDVLIRALQNQIQDPENITHQADISSEGLNILQCLQLLLKTPYTRKYFLQAGLLQGLLDCYSLYLSSIEKTHSTRGLQAFIHLFYTFLIGSTEDQHSFTLRRDILCTKNNQAIFLKGFQQFLFHHDYLIHEKPLRMAFQLMTVIGTSSESFLISLLDLSDMQSSNVSLHHLVSNIFSSNLTLTERFLLLQIVQQFLHHSPVVQIHAVSVGWIVDPLNSVQPFGIFIENALMNICSNMETHNVSTSASDISSNLLQPTRCVSKNFLLEDENSSPHYSIWVATLLLISLLQFNPLVGEKLLDVKLIQSNATCKSSLGELVTFTMLTLLRQLSEKIPKDVTFSSSILIVNNINDATFSGSTITSLILLLQLLVVWCAETTVASRRCLQDVSFVPFILDCINLREIFTEELLPPWCRLIECLAIAIITLLLQENQLPSDFILVLQTRFTLKKLAIYFRGLFAYEDWMNPCNQFILFLSDGSPKKSLFPISVSILHPYLIPTLKSLQNRVEPVLIEAYLRHFSGLPAGHLTQPVTTTNSSFDATMDTLAKPQEMIYSNPSANHCLDHFFLKELRSLREQVEFLIQEQKTQQHKIQQERLQYQTHIKILENQLRGVIKAYQQLQSKHQVPLQNYPVQFCEIETSHALSQHLLQDTNTDPATQHENLVQLLGILIHTFPDVKYFLDHFNLPETPISHEKDS